jgi:RNA polymerase sigma-70 factor (ECF subfamily)
VPRQDRRYSPITESAPDAGRRAGTATARSLAAVPDLVGVDPAEPFDFDAGLAAVTPRLLRYAARRLGNPHEAEEVVQEALLRACQHTPGFPTEDDLMAWATVVTGRLVIDRVRTRTRSVSVAEVPDDARTGRDTADVVVARDEARAALDALEAMPSRQASVLWAREVEGQSYDEIAASFGLSEPTVRSLLHRARRTLRREYAARGGTLPVAGLAVLAPWAMPLRRLGKLRLVAQRSTRTAALGTLTIGAAVAVLATTAIPGTSVHGSPAVATTHDALARAHHARHAAAASVSAATSRRPTAPVHRTTATHPAAAAAAPDVIHVLVDHTHACAPGSTSRVTGTVAGVNCVPHSTAPVLVVRVPLPNNPLGLKHVGVSNSKVDCSRLPKLPYTRCEKNPDRSSG